MHSSLLSCMKIFTSLTLCSSSAISSIKYFYALVELSPQGRKYFISIYFPDTFIFHFPVKHKKHRPRGNRFVRKNSVLNAPSGVRGALPTELKAHILLFFFVLKFCITLNASDIIYNSRLNVNRFFQKKSDFFLFHLFFLFFVVLGHFVKCFIDLFCGFPQAAEGIIKVFVFIAEL